MVIVGLVERTTEPAVPVIVYSPTTAALLYITRPLVPPEIGVVPTVIALGPVDPVGPVAPVGPVGPISP